MVGVQTHCVPINSCKYLSFVLQLFGDFESNESYPAAPSAAPVAPTPVIASTGQGCKISDYTQLASYLSSLGNGPAAAAAMAAAAAAAVSSAGVVNNPILHSYLEALIKKINGLL